MLLERRQDFEPGKVFWYSDVSAHLAAAVLAAALDGPTATVLGRFWTTPGRNSSIRWTSRPPGILAGDAPFVHVDAGRQPGATARKLFSDLHHVRRSELQAVVELIRGPALDPDRLRFWRNCWARSNRLAAACCCVALHEECFSQRH